MGTITQIAPVSDTVTIGLSQTYTNVLQSTGGVGILTWSITEPSTALTVSPSGVVSTTGPLTLGTYFTGGTVVDNNSNAGVWQFTLTTVGALSPGTGVTPVQPVLPSGVEIMVPFQIDPATGGIAVITDYGAILAQHIETIVLTSLNERVMNPAYGYGLERDVFQPASVNNLGIAQSEILAAIKKWEPRVQVQGVAIATSNTAPNLVNVTIQFAVIPFSDVNTLIVSSGGTIAQVNP